MSKSGTDKAGINRSSSNDLGPDVISTVGLPSRPSGVGSAASTSARSDNGYKDAAAKHKRRGVAAPSRGAHSVSGTGLAGVEQTQELNVLGSNSGLHPQAFATGVHSKREEGVSRVPPNAADLVHAEFRMRLLAKGKPGQGKSKASSSSPQLRLARDNLHHSQHNNDVIGLEEALSTGQNTLIIDGGRESRGLHLKQASSMGARRNRRGDSPETGNAKTASDFRGQHTGGGGEKSGGEGVGIMEAHSSPVKKLISEARSEVEKSETMTATTLQHSPRFSKNGGFRVHMGGMSSKASTRGAKETSDIDLMIEIQKTNDMRWIRGGQKGRKALDGEYAVVDKPVFFNARDLLDPVSMVKEQKRMYRPDGAFSALPASAMMLAAPGSFFYPLLLHEWNGTWFHSCIAPDHNLCHTNEICVPLSS